MPKTSQASKDARRQQILAAAMRLFARQGFQATTMPQICAEAELSVGAVYRYFASKDAIIAALVESGRRGTAELAAAARAQASPAAQLETLLRELQRPGREALNQVDVRWLAEAIGEPALQAGYRRAHAELVASLAGMLARRAPSSTPAEALAELVAAVIVGLQVRKAIEPEADIAPALNALLGLLRPGI